MRTLKALAAAAPMLAMAAPLAFSPTAKAECKTLKAVIFEEVNPLYKN